MAAHLARHLSSTHASPQKKAAAKKKRGAKKRTAARKKPGVKKVKNGRRRKRTASTRGLRNMSVEALSKLIADARAELRGKVAAIQKAIK